MISIFEKLFKKGKVLRILKKVHLNLLKDNMESRKNSIAEHLTEISTLNSYE